MGEFLKGKDDVSVFIGLNEPQTPPKALLNKKWKLIQEIKSMRDYIVQYVDPKNPDGDFSYFARAMIYED